jgi:hypothetical protein
MLGGRLGFLLAHLHADVRGARQLPRLLGTGALLAGRIDRRPGHGFGGLGLVELLGGDQLALEQLLVPGVALSLSLSSSKIAARRSRRPRSRTVRFAITRPTPRWLKNPEAAFTLMDSGARS